MTRAAVVVLALGCGTGVVPGARGRPAGPTSAAGKTIVSPLSYLSDEFERVFPGRVRLARYGAVRLDAGDSDAAVAGHGEGETIELGQSPALVVVDSRDDRLRVVVEEGEYRLLLWIDAADLHWVVSETTDLAFEAGERVAAPPAPGVRLRPGLPVVRVEERGKLAFVRHEDQCITVAGWLAADRLSRQYVPVDQPEVERDMAATAGSALLERPNGRELARFTSECHVAYSGREEAGQKLVVYEGNGFEARGWIATGTATAGSGTLFGYGRGFGSFTGGERVLVPGGTCIYARRGGPVVGVATDDAEEAGAQQGEGGWLSMSVATGWGDLTLWVVEEKPSAEPAAAVDSADDDSEETLLLGPRKVKQLALRKCR